MLWRKRLDQALDFWVEGGKAREQLLAGALLRESEAQLKEHGEPLSHEERALIGASVAADRRARRIRAAIVGSVVFVVIAAGIWALVEAHLAREQHDLAVARQLATEARFTFEQQGDLQRSLLLAAASLGLAWTHDGFEAWSKAIELSPRRPSIIRGPDEGPYASVTLSPDGSRMAAAGKNSILLLDSASLTEGAPAKKLPQAGATTLAFSPDSQLLASGAGNRLALWSIAQQQLMKEFRIEPPGRATSIAFDSGAKRLATAGWNYFRPTIRN